MSEYLNISKVQQSAAVTI